MLNTGVKLTETTNS